MSAFIENRVSIITPAFRAAGTIDATIESVIAQDWADWELLIADDCSPDGTRAHISAWSEREPRVRLIALEKNGGPAAARNAAITQATGRWLAFLDADDLWLPGKLSRQIAFQRDTGAKISFTGFRRINADASEMGRYVSVPKRLTYRRLLGNTAIATSTAIVDRTISGPTEMKKTYYDDFALWADILRSGGFAAGLDEDLMRYRVLPASVSRNKRNSSKQVWLAYRRIEKLNPVAAARYFVEYAVRGMLKYRQF